MKSNKEYRFNNNPKEEEFHNKFKAMFEADGMAVRTLSAIIFGWKNDTQNIPNETLSLKEENICVSLIQWLGTPVGQGFLDSCGFVPKKGTSKLKWLNAEKHKPIAGQEIIFIDAVGMYKGTFHAIRAGVVYVDGAVADTVEWEDIYQWFIYPDEC